ncbi:MAG: amino acid ABC transporter permease, partial [Bacillota bacterium]
LFLIFYGFPNLGIKFPPFVAAVLGIGIRSAAYQSQIFRGAIQSVSGSQFKAGLSLGMNYFQVFWHVILPQAIRISIPPFANEAAIVLKDTSLAFALGVIELLRQGRYIISTTYQPLLIFSLVAAIYFIMTFVIHRGLDLFEARMQIPGIGSEGNAE